MDEFSRYLQGLELADSLALAATGHLVTPDPEVLRRAAERLERFGEEDPLWAGAAAGLRILAAEMEDQTAGLA
jgi:hypothetical protein